MSRPWTFRRFAIAGAFILAAWLASSLLRHSLIADDEGPSEAPQVETPPSATPPPAIPSLSIPPVPTGSGVVSDPTRDPLFQEFRRLVSDPANGLSVPSLSIRSPLEATLAEGVSQLRENRQRLKCIEKLTDAATLGSSL